jgi:DNA helicase-2/ATP-dependent DNA helicase PcrA
MDPFEEAYKSLNIEQKLAVDAIEGPVMVVAGPGTGKTQMLTLRIANILKQTDAAPDSILALTFTESGVASMRARLSRVMGSAASKIAIHTFHGFCNSVIERYPEAFPEIIGARQMDDASRLLLIREALESTDAYLLRPLGDPLYHLQTIAAGIADAKREYVSPEALKAWALAKCEETKNDPDAIHTKGAHKGKMKGAYTDLIKKYEKHAEFSDVYSRYEALRRERRLYDYEDMIIEVVRAFERDLDFLLTLQEKYQYLLADEHQDANNAQNRLLELLASYHPNPNLFVVGDPDQAIYRFQGASVENFRSFKKQYPEALVITLRDNYRSAQEILNAISPLSLEDAAGEGTEALRAARENEKAKIEIITAPDPLSERGAVAESVLADIEDGIMPDEIAILVRKNKDARLMGEVFRKKDIPYHIVSGTSFFDEPMIRDFLRLMRALALFGEEGALAEALPAPFLNIDPFDLYKLKPPRRQTKTSLYEIIASKQMLKEASIGDSERVLVLGKKLKEWKANERSLGLLVAVETLARESGFIAALLAAEGSIEKIESYRSLFEYIASFATDYPDATYAFLLERLDLIREYRLKGVSAKLLSEGKVRIMTVHAAKGLEYASVYLAGGVENNWEGMRDRSNFSGVFEISGLVPSIDEGTEDERRLFYVALSRAKRRLTISYASTSETGRELLPSNFLSEMGQKDLERRDIDQEVGRSLLVAEPVAHRASEEVKKYLRALFLEQGLTPTALNNYLKDPWEYFFQNLLRLPASPESHQLFGTAVHAALERFFMESKEQGAFLGKKELLAYFDDALEREPFSLRDLKEAKRRGKAALSGYFGVLEGDMRSIDLSTLKGEYPLSGSIDVDGTPLPLSGKVDRMEESAGLLRVIDYKTGKPKTRNEIEGNTKSSDGSYKRQLVFYKLLLSLEGREMTEAVLEFVEPDQKGESRRESFAISEAEVEELKDTLKRVSKEIMDMSFWDAEPKEDNPYKDLVVRIRGEI